ncbi:MAG: Arginine biosynthesis bifunctional protein ArgJ [Verrucomicrobiales bacterium]|nr:Arginine biosynthesis bifunctional protein ArgJ [Verrucomicrobiales bacterium]
MAKTFKIIPGSITAPSGFLGAAVFCDIKRLGTGKGSNKGKKRDLALIVSEVPATVAGMFTTNQICAAPVKVCAERVRGGEAQAIVVNSGNANACTGKQGMKDAYEMTAILGRELHMPEQHIMVGSTGRIGVTMPMENLKRGILDAAWQLNSTVKNADAVAEAIMTSDTRPKQIAIELQVGGKRVRVGGICKGAGMIQPGMSATGKRPAAAPQGLHATMLCFITTDVAIEAKALQACLQEAVAVSFNRITVDGDMSTNDTVLVLANGLAENAVLKKGSKDLAVFQEALSHVCLELAKKIVRDGEGVTRFVTIRVNGARNFADADAAVRAVGNSSLVKTSWFGGDPNWGRIIDALGYSPAKIVEEKVDIAYAAPGSKKLVYSLKRGQPASTPFKTLCQIAAEKEFELHINLNLGKGSAVLYAADLTEEYVDFNKGDVTDPSSMGG